MATPTITVQIRWCGQRGEAAAAELRRLAAALAERRGVVLLVQVDEHEPVVGAAG